MATLSAQDVACYAIQGGFSGSDVARMTVIAKLESGFRTDARNPISVCTGTECGHATGLWQIVDFPSRVSKYGDLTDPATNARAAYDIYRTQGLAAWSTWTTAIGLAFQAASATGSMVGINFASLPTSGGSCGGSTTQALNSAIPGVPDVGKSITDAEQGAAKTLTTFGTALVGIIVAGIGFIVVFSAMRPGAASSVKTTVSGLAKAALMLAK